MLMQILSVHIHLTQNRTVIDRVSVQMEHYLQIASESESTQSSVDKAEG